ncbi:MAG: High-affinity branched-chain amino acid transport system permease protein LivH, partial [uncultured Acetobacteraceae bacterium]
GGRQPRRHGGAQRADARGAVFHRGQRLLADFRPDAHREHGARLTVPDRRLRGLRGVRAALRPGRLVGLVRGRGGGHRGGGRLRLGHAGGAARLDAGAGAAAGAGDHRRFHRGGRPTPRGLRRQLAAVLPARRAVRRDGAARRRPLPDLPPVPDRRRRGGGARPLAAAESDQARLDGAGRRGRQADADRAGHQRAARLARGFRPGGRARGARRRHRRLGAALFAGRGRALPADLARGGHRGRHGVHRRHGGRRPAGRHGGAGRAGAVPDLLGDFDLRHHGRRAGAAAAGHPGQARL